MKQNEFRLAKTYELVMVYDLNTINYIRRQIRKGNEEFDYSNVGDLAYMLDHEHNTAVYLGGYVDDRRLTFTFNEDGDNIDCEYVFWEDINSVEKLYNAMLNYLTKNNFRF